MQGFQRAGAGALLTVAALAAAPAAHAAGVGVTQISSLPAGAKAGNLTGVVTNESDRAARAVVSVRVMRRKTDGALIGRTSVDVAVPVWVLSWVSGPSATLRVICPFYGDAH